MEKQRGEIILPSLGSFSDQAATGCHTTECVFQSMARVCDSANANELAECDGKSHSLSGTLHTATICYTKHLDKLFAPSDGIPVL